MAEGRVELDAPVERYLPGVVRGNGNDGGRVTVRQLLQHTSGLPDYLTVLDPFAESTRWGRFEPAELVKLAMGEKPEFPPGEKWRYSNTNYILAGMLVEKVTQRSVRAEITRRIVEPLKLRGTYFPRSRETAVRGPHPRGYLLQEDGGHKDHTRMNTTWAGAAGAMVSTGNDLNRFFTALLAGRLLPEAQLAEMKRTVPDTLLPAGGGYGLGLRRAPLSCGGHYWGHGGTVPGLTTRGGATADGRSANVTLNQAPVTGQTADATVKAVDTALCPTR